MEGTRTKLLRPRVLVYTGLLLAIAAAMAANLYFRVPLKVDVIRDRAAIAREVEGGLIENVYRLQVMNTVEQARAFDLVVTGLPGIHVWGEAIIGVGAATSRSVPVKIRVPLEAVKPGSYPIEIQVRAIGVAGVEVSEATVFIVR
jgi:polyferredoxin